MGRCFQIGRLRFNGARVGGTCRRRWLPAAGLAGLGPNRPLRGSIRRSFGSRMDYAPCVVHLWPERGTGRLGAARASAAAGVRGGTSPARGVLATRVAYKPLQHAQKEEGCQEVLTEGSWWRSCCAGWTSARSSGGDGAELAVWVVQGSSGPLGGTDRCAASLRSRQRG